MKDFENDQYRQHIAKSTDISKSKEDIVREVQLLDWEDDREHFSSRFYYILAMIQICLSFHGIFGCPLASINHGGVAFFIPYTLFTIILGYPIHFMEISLGQYSQLGPLKVWDCAPLARGIGLSSICLSLIVAFYNNAYAIYAVIYFSRSFDAVLPWSDCDEYTYKNRTCVPRMSAHEEHQYTPAQHYFYDHILQEDSESHLRHYHIGKFIWQHCLAFAYSWFVVFVGLYKNIQSLERILPIFIGIPVFSLLVLLSISLQLHGAFQGFKEFFSTSNFSHLGKISTWCSAVEVVLLQLGIAQGTLIAYGSYAFHRNKTHKDSMRIICTNYAMSLGVTVIVWLFLASLKSERIGAELPYNLKDFSYVFVVFPEVLGRISGGRLWCFLFFLLIFFSCVNAQIPLVQTVICCIYDQFPQLLEIRYVLNLAVCTMFASLGILLCSSNIWVLLQSFYEIPNILSRIPIASSTVAIIVLVYGLNKYCEDLHFLIDYYPSFIMRFLFYMAPFLMLGLYLGSHWMVLSPLSLGNLALFKFLLYLILIWKPIGVLYWVLRSAIYGEVRDFWRSLESWGPGDEKARIARAYFSSESRVTLSMPWRKRNYGLNME